MTMPVLKRAAVLAAVTLLAACSHGFEGEYRMKPANPLIEAISEGMGAQIDTQVVIGRDYIDIDGERTAAKIFVRESGATRYLVLRDAGSGEEDVMKIEDDRSLLMDGGLGQMRLTRIDP